jgi:hypothetical protein
LYNALKAYKTQNDDKDFAFMHCFKKLEGCKKWNEVRLTLKEAGDIEGLTPPMVASVGHPTGHKKAKELGGHTNLFGPTALGAPVW